MICVVSVVDSISATSMPVNEFVIYRSVHNYNIHQVLIVCDSQNNNICIPENIEVYLVGNDKKKIRSIIKRLRKQFNKIVYHLHHQKSAICFFTATMGLGIRKNTLYTVHSTFSDRDIKYRISSCLCSLLSNYANCVSESAYDEYSKIIKAIKKKHFIYIRNGVDTERIENTMNGKNPSLNDNYMICVGRMIPIKNHKFLVSLMNKLPNYILVIIGAEDKDGEIRGMVEKAGLSENVIIKGLIPREEVFSELAKAKIYLSASLVEGLPVSVLEAMQVGLIPIISSINPHKEIANICPEVSCIDLDEEKWLKEIVRINSEDNIVEKSNAIREKTKSMFSLDTMHNYYMQVYRKLV